MLWRVNVGEAKRSANGEADSREKVTVRTPSKVFKGIDGVK
jgi:hypothetical protein